VNNRLMRLRPVPTDLKGSLPERMCRSNVFSSNFNRLLSSFIATAGRPAKPMRSVSTNSGSLWAAFRPFWMAVMF
jgi:hypothetical protein